MSQRASDARSTLGLACAGGVIEGTVYEIGALCALDEVIEGTNLHDLDVYVGVSSGSLMGAMLANGVPAREMSRAIVSQSQDAKLNLEPEVLFRPAVGEYTGRLGRWPGALLSSLRYHLLNPGDLSLLGFLATFGSVMPAGMFTNAPLERFLAEALSGSGRTDDFRQLRAKLRVVAMNLDSAELTVFGQPGLEEVPISRAIRASTALPGLYTPVDIGGQSYIDGVARRTVHASAALDEGADLVFCVNPIVPIKLQMDQHARNLLASGTRGRQESLADHGLPAVLSQTFRSIVDSRKKTGFKKYEYTHPEADLILIEPECDDTSPFFSNIFSFKNRRDVCEHAYQSTRQYLRTQTEDLEPVLNRHGLSLRSHVLDEDRSLYDGSYSLSEDSRDGSDEVTKVLDEVDQTLNRLDHVLDQVSSTSTDREGPHSAAEHPPSART